ncbi:peritrophin-44-like [Eupeodes corollae]|uniref:peritrophin-44-like n=1 Tax=Eupeodes corollae TaxID=290404 RepID=UPI0024918B1D|nr:peritrophin-44-like [Eupeodes corollae]
MKVLIFLLALIGASYGQVEPYGSNICRLFADGVRLRNPGSCDSYITCNDGVEEITQCTGKNSFYNKDSKKCVSKAPDSYCKDPCNKKSPFWEADPKSCNGYFKCTDHGGVQDYCPDDLDFDFKEQACVYKSDSKCKGFNYCDIVPNNDVSFKNEKNCEKYYTCVKNKLKESFCNKGYYDVQRGCVKKSEVDCPVHPIPNGICGTAKRPVRDKFVDDERTCSGYLYCHDRGDNVVDEKPTIGRCPEGRFFDTVEQGCITAENVKCDEDRCDNMNSPKVISSELGCQHYLICKDGVMVAEEKCPEDMYFDVDTLECTTDVKSYPACSL